MELARKVDQLSVSFGVALATAAFLAGCDLTIPCSRAWGSFP